MKKKSYWPTLEGRLSQPLETEVEALLQLQTMVPLSELGIKRLKKLTNNKNINKHEQLIKQEESQRSIVGNLSENWKAIY